MGVEELEDDRGEFIGLENMSEAGEGIGGIV